MMFVTDQADIAIAMMRARLTPDQAIALTYGAEIADVIKAMTRRRKVTAARRLGRQAGR